MKKKITAIIATIATFVFFSSANSEEKLDETVESDAVIIEMPDQEIKDDSQNFSEFLNSSVTSWCVTYSNGQGIRILAKNTSNRNIYCTITCPYKTKNGYSGQHKGSGTVRANSAKHVWSHKFKRGEKFNVSRGSQNCRS